MQRKDREEDHREYDGPETETGRLRPFTIFSQTISMIGGTMLEVLLLSLLRLPILRRAQDLLLHERRAQ